MFPPAGDADSGAVAAVTSSTTDGSDPAEERRWRFAPRRPRASGVLRAWLLLLLGVACAPKLPQDVAVGEAFVDENDGFRLAVPPGWAAQDTGRGSVLTRSQAYAGGFPQILVRPAGEGDVLSSSDSLSRRPGGDMRWRYARWGNSRGQGWRLEALIELDTGPKFWTESAVWDPAAKVDAAFFEREIVPILHSIDAP